MHALQLQPPCALKAAAPSGLQRTEEPLEYMIVGASWTLHLKVDCDHEEILLCRILSRIFQERERRDMGQEFEH